MDYTRLKNILFFSVMFFGITQRVSAFPGEALLQTLYLKLQFSAALTAYNAGHDTGNREYAEKVMAAAERWRTE